MPPRAQITSPPPPGNEPMSGVWQGLMTCANVREYQAAFTCATGIPLTLLPRSSVAPAAAMPRRGDACVQGCMGGNSGQLCWCAVWPAEQRAAETARPVQFCCAAGLVMILTPVVVRGSYLGGVVVGPFALGALDGRTLRELKRQLAKHDLPGSGEALRKVWNRSPTVSLKKKRAVEQMIALFAEYLSERAVGFISAEVARVPPILGRVEAFMTAHGPEQLPSLRQMAADAHLSPCHFYRVFKKQTGLTLTKYRLRRQIELAGKLLLETDRRVSEVAFAAGFESIPYFNRVFRRQADCSPTAYRRNGIAAMQVKKMQIQA